jgi:hypothetical protein
VRAALNAALDKGDLDMAAACLELLRAQDATSSTDTRPGVAGTGGVINLDRERQRRRLRGAT